jgi:hypothetical protein
MVWYWLRVGSVEYSSIRTRTLRGKISPHQTDQTMRAVASDMAFKVALVIKNLALIFGFEAEFGIIKSGLIFW